MELNRPIFTLIGKRLVTKHKGIKIASGGGLDTYRYPYHVEIVEVNGI